MNANVLRRTTTTAATGRPPHLVFVLADDLGFHGVGYRNAMLHTPTIDALASDGLRLDSFYTAKLCGPSRAALLTGRLPYKLQASIDNLAFFWIEEGEHESYVFLPEQLRRRGYRTVAIGKWHAGFYKKALLPTSRGFDHFYGFLGGCQDHTTQEVCCEPCNRRQFPGVDRPVDLHRDDVPALGDNGTRIFSHNSLRFASAAVEVVRSHAAEQPPHSRLFLYLALQDPHAPFQTPKRFEAMYSHAQPLRNAWSGMVSAIDETLANVTSALKAGGMWSETLLVFASDNGSPVTGWGAGGSNFPLRGGKGSVWEGGLRTFGVVNGGWLPTTRRGVRLDGLAHIVDLYATFCVVASGVRGDGAREAAAAAACLKNSGITKADSLDLSAWWEGRQPSSPRDEILHEHMPKEAVLRRGPFKLIAKPAWQADWFGEFAPSFNASVLAAGAKFDQWQNKALDQLRQTYADGNITKRAHAMKRLRLLRTPSIQKLAIAEHNRREEITRCSWQAPCLFDVKADPEERRDLAAAMPSKVAEMKDRVRELSGASTPGYRARHFGVALMPNRSKNSYCAAAAAHSGFMVPWR